jgi:uncharacterized protein YuzB (UPF0349 family)
MNHFRFCLTGSNLDMPASCTDADLDGDNDVDMADFGILQRCLTVPGQSMDPNCCTMEAGG